MRPLAPILVALAACGDPVTAAQLVLTPDPELAPAAMVASQVRDLRVVVDAPDGVAGVDVPGERALGGTAEDWDADGDLEVLFDTEVPTTSTLPVLEVGLDDNAGRELEFLVLGYSTEADLIARGGVAGSCPRGELCKLGTSFNLKAHARPPKVILALPPDNTVHSGAPPSAVVLQLSTTVDPASLTGRVQLVGPDGVFPTTLSLEILVYSGPDGTQEQRTLLQLSLNAVVDDGLYTITVHAGVTSSAGLRFDQDPTTPAEDSFESHFRFEEVVGGGGCGACPTGFVCDESVSECVPATGCRVGCAAGFACDPDQQQCVERCDTAGPCAGGLTCHPESGLCD